MAAEINENTEQYISPYTYLLHAVFPNVSGLCGCGRANRKTAGWGGSYGCGVAELRPGRVDASSPASTLGPFSLLVPRPRGNDNRRRSILAEYIMSPAE